MNAVIYDFHIPFLQKLYSCNVTLQDFQYDKDPAINNPSCEIKHYITLHCLWHCCTSIFSSL